jgi:mono/diheme cytochrome c family protein
VTRAYPIAALLVLLALVGESCSSLPAQPEPEAVQPDRVTDFALLYKQNCSACHGAEGWGGAAYPLADPVYQAVVDNATLRKVTAEGIPHSLMPAFAGSSGGMLSDRQIDAIVQGMRQQWAKPDALAGAARPPYAATAPGDAQRGGQVYSTFCASCHGPEGKGGAKASSIVDGSYLGLVSDQELRTAVICGRPDLNAPDWRNDVPGRAMTEQEISDVVAWLISQRPQFPGQPYPGPTAGGSP